ncbi:MAG: twitching motility protein PilT [Ignavibacteria bacterium RBG_16_34_14]|nr:MAG: twitching motility protein PilT [Ignavibacteria bacterium RBG_16_34_14]
MKKVYFRFYEELNDFLPPEKRKIKFEHSFIDRTSVKDVIESFGIPHTEIDLILVNGKSVDFSYIVNDKDEISVYPVFESLDISDVQHLRPQPLREPKFVLDVHLGKLTRYMRMLGFDSIYKNNYKDDELVKISLNNKSTILTRDRGILKRNDVTHGYWVRNENPEEQLKEIIERFDLRNHIKEFTRCLECNILLNTIEKEKVLDRLPSKVKEWHNEFYLCPQCNRIYWKGSHYEKMNELILKIKNNIS